MQAPVHRWIVALLLTASVVAVAAGCSDDTSVVAASADDETTESAPKNTPETTTTEPTLPEPTAEVFAATAYQLMTVDHTFGEGPTPFTEFVIGKFTDPNAGPGDEPTTVASRPLTDGERSAVESRLSPLGEVTWIDDALAYEIPVPRSPNERSAVISFGEPAIDGRGALAPIEMTCGDVCGLALTYKLTQEANGGWEVTGDTGMMEIS